MENKLDLTGVEYGAGLIRDDEIKQQKDIKYDRGKARMCEMIQDFAKPLEEVAKVWAFGADKYEKGNWRYVSNGLDRYTNALVRHLLAEKDKNVDPESGLYHAAHVAWNALARLHFLLEIRAAELGRSEGVEK